MLGLEEATGAGNGPALQRCEHAGCQAEGLYRAPKSRERMNDYYWFCLDHVRDYNRAWDYYAGMTADQIEAITRRDTVWERPTWPLGRWPHSHRIFGAEFIPDDIDILGERRRAEAQSRPKTKHEQALASWRWRRAPPSKRSSAATRPWPSSSTPMPMAATGRRRSG